MRRLLVAVLLFHLGGPICVSRADELPQRFVSLSQFQVWADAATPDVFRKLNRQYLTDGHSHVFRLYPHYDLFLDVVRPHLKLVASVSDLRASIVRDEISTPPTLGDVQAWLEQRNAAQRRQHEPKIPINVAGRPACFGSTSNGLEIRRLGAIADHTIGPRFSGAYTDPVRRDPVRATFALDFGTVRTVRAISVTPCLHPDENVYVATDFSLETRWQNQWQPVPGSAI